MPVKITKYFGVVYFLLSFFIYCYSLLNYSASAGIVRYIFNTVYLFIFMFAFVHEYKQPSKKYEYIGGIILILGIFTVKDTFLLVLMLVFLIFLLTRIKKFRWLYIIFTVIFATFFALTIFIDNSLLVETSICDISPSGSKILSRDVYDRGALGYGLTYYITEKHTLFERKYVVAARGQMNSSEDNRFIDDNNLNIQGIIYDISGSDIVFHQVTTGKLMHRKKRNYILFIL